MKQRLIRLLKVIGCIIGIIYFPYLLGKMYNALIYSKLGVYYTTQNNTDNWICGVFTTGALLIIVFILYRIYDYVVNDV
jgi:hypothetical protein